MANLSNINNKFLVTTGGNVGIGVTGPTEKLVVASTAGFIATFQSLTATDFRPIRFINSSGANVGFLGNNGSTNEFFLVAQDRPLIFGTGNGGAERMRIASSGVTTIGMTNTFGSAEVRIGFTGNATGNGTGKLQFVNSNSYKSWQISAGGTPLGALAFTQSASFGQDDFTEEIMRITSAGNVGIGETAPSAKLHVLNSTKTLVLEQSASGRFNAFGFDGSNPYITYYASQGMIIGYGASTGNKPTINTMFLGSNGNVGIGTDSPVTLKSYTTLQVKGNIKVGDSNAAGLISLGDIASAGANAGIWRGAAGAYAGVGNFLNLGGFDGIAFTTGNADIASQTERMRISSAGDVGIGTTPTVGYNLDVKRTSPGYSIVGRHATGGKVGIYNSTGDNGIGTVNNYAFNLFTNNSAPQVTIATTGNVGIGTTITTVGGSGTQTSTANPTRMLFNNNFSNGYTDASLKLYLFNSGTTRHGFTSGPQFDLQYHASGHPTDSRHEFYTNNNFVMRVGKGDTANVGIGTASPSAKLEVRKGGTTAAQGDTDLIVQDSTAASSTAQVQILGGATGFSNLYFSDTSTYNVGGFIYNHSSNYLATNVNGSEKMRITSGGKVIVGTDSSNALEVFSSGDTEIGFSYASHGNVYAKIIGDITQASPLGGEMAFQTATGGTLSERMRISSAGLIKFNNYGAGTLVTDASGNITASSGGGSGGPFLPLSAGTGFPLTGSLVSNFQLFVKDGVNIPVSGGGAINAFSRTVSTNLFSALRVWDNTSASSFWDIGATGGSSTLLNFYHNANTTPKISFTHTGGAVFTSNVGIGTTLPTTLLNTLTTANSENMTLGSAANMGFKVGNTSSNVYGICMGVGDSGRGWIQVGRTDGTAIAYDLSLQASGGNVGIGTNVPSAKLDVFSAASFRADVATGNPLISIVNNTATSNTAGTATIKFTQGNTQAGGKIVSSRDANYSSGATRASNLEFYTSTAATDTMKMIIDSDGNVGIGTTSPNAPLEIFQGGSGKVTLLQLARPNTAGLQSNIQFTVSDIMVGQIQHEYVAANLNHMSFTLRAVNGSDIIPLWLENSGNVGIGTTSPDSLLQLESSANPDVELKISNTATVASGQNFGGSKVRLIADGTNGDGHGALRHALVSETDSYANWEIRSGNSLGTLAFDTGSSERMRITSGGDLYVGHTSTNPTNGFSVLGANAATYIQIDHINGTASGNDYTVFRYNQSTIGTIRQNGTSQVQYNVSSDYRLKEDLQDFAGLDMVSKIPVYDFKWKVDENRSYGVMAHELQEVLPDAVSGDKDAEEMQGVDYSKIVPLLVKSIQELEAKIKILENK